MTNLSIPASLALVITCSSSGVPCTCTSGLGPSPDRAAMRLPFPAARIKANLAVCIVCLRQCVVGSRGRRIECRLVIEIADAHLGGAEHSRLGYACGLQRKP